MGKIYIYFLRTGMRKAEIICTTKAEAEKEREEDSRRIGSKVSRITTERTPYAVPVK